MFNKPTLFARNNKGSFFCRTTYVVAQVAISIMKPFLPDQKSTRYIHTAFLWLQLTLNTLQTCRGISQHRLGKPALKKPDPPCQALCFSFACPKWLNTRLAPAAGLGWGLMTDVLRCLCPFVALVSDPSFRGSPMGKSGWLARATFNLLRGMAPYEPKRWFPAKLKEIPDSFSNPLKRFQLENTIICRKCRSDPSIHLIGTL